MYKRIKKEAKIIGLAMAMGLGLAVLVGAYTFLYSEAAQREIADNVLRFHVLAHSNDPVEQELKDAVRAAVLAEFEPMLTGSASLAETRDFIAENKNGFAQSAQAVLSQAGAAHGVTAEISHRFFPTVVYGDIVFPPGKYETLTLIIGDGAGRNWWCLMFPPLCYVEMTSTAQTRTMLEEHVPPAGLALLTHQLEPNNPTVQVRFRVVEWWQNRRQSTPPPRDLHHAQH
ncbi:MAG: stage II sporulation protein R [Defluviitaleaceae bacterium]|nr:stage II sporulation protein R [Defluviitaleaceae bacterium]